MLVILPISNDVERFCNCEALFECFIELRLDDDLDTPFSRSCCWSKLLELFWC